MEEIRTYRPGEVIFRQGDPGDCMYDIQFGKVGIYYNYGKPDEKLLSELFPDQLFGEMGLLEHAPRSATAVSLADQTALAVVTEEGFYEFFEKNPPKVLMLMQQMTERLRRTTKDYLEACSTVCESVSAEKAGKPKSKSLLSKIRRFSEFYRGNVLM